MYKFQYYPNDINSSQTAGWVTIDRFIDANINPKPGVIKLFDAIHECDLNGDKEGKAKLKEKLYSFTPCVNVSVRRRYADITAFTGLMVLDFDKIDNAQDFKEFLFSEYNFIYICWISPSKKGVKALVQIPEIKLTTWQESTNEFKSYFYGIADEMQQYNGFDPTGQNCVLPLFQSMDREMLVNPFPFKWMDKGYKLNNFETSKPIEINYTGEKRESTILKIINTGLNKIIDNGHPQLRSLCIAVGGYIANGYIDYSTALSEICNRIDANSYLQKGLSGYKKTAKTSINMGMTKPLSL
jgi:hypothetical protein